MLLPNERRSLEECLRPPVGFSLDCAIATTFSLDLLALLEAPLAFTMFEWQESGQRPRAAAFPPDIRRTGLRQGIRAPRKIGRGGALAGRNGGDPRKRREADNQTGLWSSAFTRLYSREKGTGSVAQSGVTYAGTLPPRCLSPFPDAQGYVTKGDRHRRRKASWSGHRLCGDGASPLLRLRT